MKRPEDTLKIREYTALDLAVTSEEGDKINGRIEELLDEVEVLIIDFENINLMTTAFLNAAIGQLYRHHTSDDLNRQLRVVNMQQTDLLLLKKVIDTAKEYYKDSNLFYNTAKDSFGHD